MSTWTADELDRVGAAEELRLASYRPDGTLRPAVTIWVVRVGGDVVVRSAYGPGNGWFRRAQASGRGRVEAGGVTTEVRFAAADPDAHEAVDAAYHAKYDRHGPRIVGSVVGPGVVDVTLRLEPAED
jgi:hypothetical protein